MPDDSLRSADKPAETEPSSGPLLAIGDVFGLLGLSWALRRKPRDKSRPRDRKLAAAAALAVPAFALPESLGFAEPVTERTEPRGYTPHEARLSPFRGKPGAGARKSRRRLGYILLAAGSVAAIPASVTRVPVSPTGETVSRVVAERARMALLVSKHDPVASVAHAALAHFVGIGVTGHAPVLASTPEPMGRGIGPNPGGGGGGASGSGGTGASSSGGTGGGSTTGGEATGGSSSGGSSSRSGATSSGGAGGDAGADGSSTGGASSDGGSLGGGGRSHPGEWVGTDPGSSGGAIDVPEPDTISLLALGIIGLAIGRSRRLRQRLAGAAAGATGSDDDLAGEVATVAD